MKLIIALGVVFVACLSCMKNNSCANAEIIKTHGICFFDTTWGIKLGKNIYVADSIPTEFQQPGLQVCVQYHLYEDMRMCPCCGGTHAQVISIKKAE